MSIAKLSEVALKAKDDSGDEIILIYALDRDHYAVYGTNRRIGIQYADDPEEERKQRGRLAKIQVLRGQINGLVDDWRTSRFPGDQDKARRFDRRGADALVMALEGYGEDACAALEELKQDVLEDRTSWARFLYLIVSGALASLVVVIAYLCTGGLNDRTLSIFNCNTWALFFAGGAGALGAFFSIAIAIHNRTILTDQNLRDNTADALLRILIGVLSAVALMCLLYSHVVTFDAFTNKSMTEGSDPGSYACFEYNWSTVVSIAFLAGFSERFVPDLLARSAAKLGGPGGPPVGPSGGSGGGGSPAPAPAPAKPTAGPGKRLARRLGLGRDHDEAPGEPGDG